MNDLVKTAITAAEKAAKIIRSSYGKVSSFHDKSPNDLLNLVTAADKQSERLIRSTIKKAFPTHNIVGEEYGEDIGNSNYKWVIDPIDGTRNYFKGFREFAISIGVVKDNKPYVGVIYDPLDDNAYWAVAKKGAFLGNNRLYVAETKQLREASVSMNHGKTREKRKKTLAALTAIWDLVPLIKIQGSTAYSTTQLLEGKFDALIDNGDFWDFAAALVLVKEAGGKVTTWDGQEVNENSRFVLWSNANLHNQLLTLLSPILQNLSPPTSQKASP